MKLSETSSFEGLQSPDAVRSTDHHADVTAISIPEGFQQRTSPSRACLDVPIRTARWPERQSQLPAAQILSQDRRILCSHTGKRSKGRRASASARQRAVARQLLSHRDRRVSIAASPHDAARSTSTACRRATGLPGRRKRAGVARRGAGRPVSGGLGDHRPRQSRCRPCTAASATTRARTPATARTSTRR